MVLTVIGFIVSNHHLQAQMCFSPTNIQTVTKGKTFIDLLWFHSPGANFDHYEIKLIHKIADPDTITYESTITTFAIHDLQAGQQYEVDLRTICTNGSSTIQKYFFTTVLENENSCDIHLDIIERTNLQCGLNPQFFDIEVSNVPGTQMGIDIDFAGIELIINHPSPSDLIFSLISPSGKVVLLSHKNGVARNHYGDPTTSNCAIPIVFTPLACNSISGLSGPLTGAVLPEESFTSFRDSTNPNGIWKLRICDDFVGDPGFLQYIKLNFSNDACTPSPDVYFTNINAEEISVSIANFSQCDSVIVEIVAPGRSPGFGLNKGHPENILYQLPCGENTYTLSDLLPDQQYKLFNRTQCPDDRVSFNSCGQSFKTLCKNAPLQSGFESLDICSDNCIEACTLDDIWSNQSQSGLKWIVHSGPTETNLTGPDSDVFGRGRYIYVEASDPECLQSGPAEIISQCLHWELNDADCHISFNYHMSGPESGDLRLFITENGGITWTKIWEIEGDQGNQWNSILIDIGQFTGQNVQLKFAAQPGGSLGDIALDEISLMGNVNIVNHESVFYADQDEDGFGDPHNYISICALFPPPGYVDNHLDCNDTDPMINPDATEIPCNLIDDNCSGQIDDVVGGLNIVSALIADASCNGIDDGKITLTVEGGLGPYTFAWSNDSVDMNQTGLSPGFYSVTISDQNECESILTNMYVGVKTAFQITLDQITPSSCSGIMDAALSISIAGQFPVNTYSFQWSNNETTQNLSNITNGNYQVTITNAMGCTEISPVFTVGALNSLQLSLEEIKNTTCPGAGNGSIRLRAFGGASPYHYNWEHTVENVNTQVNLSPGTYRVTITDQQGCNTSNTYILSDPGSIKIRLKTLDPVTCPAAYNGKIQIELTGGNAPYSYKWKNEDNFYYSKNILQARSGWYFLTVTDSVNCKVSLDSIFVDSPPAFELNNLVIHSNRCLSSTQGHIHFELSGGTPDYLYLWSNQSTQPVLDSLANGTYTLTVYDQFDCKYVTDPFHILSEDRPLDLDLTDFKDILCYGDKSGELIVEVKDGVWPYEFHWSNGRKVTKLIQSDTLINLSRGAYRITITDNEGCLGVLQNMEIRGPVNPLAYSVEDYKSPTCHTSADGFIRLMAMGGTAPYQFIWDNGEPGNEINGLTQGIFNCTITDNNGCEIYILPLQMNRPDSIIYAMSYDGRLCEENRGTASIGVFGGVPPYDIHWNHDSYTGLGTSIVNAPCGWYNIEIMDNAGCQINIDFLLDMTIATENEKIDQSFRLYPVPARNMIYLESSENKNLNGPFQIMNAQGNPVESLNTESHGRLQFDISRLPAGYYRMVWNHDGKIYSLPFLVH